MGDWRYSSTYCHVSGVCVTNKTGFWVWWSNLLDLDKTGYNSSQITIWQTVIFLLDILDFWPHFTNPLLRCTQSHLLTAPHISPRHGPHGKHHLLLSIIRVCWSVIWNGCSSIVEHLCSGNVFSEPLPSNGHMPHNIWIIWVWVVSFTPRAFYLQGNGRQ
jgi:hypothetical protein